MRAAGYVRVSTLEQSKNGYSVGEQVKRLEKYIDARGWTLHKIYIDAGCSGADMDRDGLKEMLRHSEEKRFDAVAVYKLDRLSRSQKDTLEIIEDILTPSGVSFVSITESFDTGTPYGMAMVGLLSVFAQLEREQIKERMAIGIEGRAREGKWHGTKCSPVGYKYEDGHLHVIPYEAMMVHEAFELFAKRVPINRICTDFMKRGYRHRYGYFLASSMGKMLRNKLYAGHIEKNGELYKGRHEAIIDQELFDQVQRIFEERDSKAEYSFKRNSALSGLLRCKHCGAKYCRHVGHTKQDGTKSVFYSCYSRNKKVKEKIKNPNCKNRIWRMEELDTKVFEEITKLSLDTSFIEDIKAANAAESDAPERIMLMEKRIAEITAQISKYSDLYSIDGMDASEVQAKIEPLAKERHSLRTEVAHLKKATEASVEEAYETAQSFGAALESGNLDDIRFVIEELIDEIVLDGEKVEIHWSFS